MTISTSFAESATHVVFFGTVLSIGCFQPRRDDLIQLIPEMLNRIWVESSADVVVCSRIYKVAHV